MKKTTIDTENLSSIKKLSENINLIADQEAVDEIIAESKNNTGLRRWCFLIEQQAQGIMQHVQDIRKQHSDDFPEGFEQVDEFDSLIRPFFYLFDSWLKEKIQYYEYDDGSYFITFPLTDRFKNKIGVFLEEQENGRIRLSDRAYILNNLQKSNVLCEGVATVLKRVLTNREIGLDRKTYELYCETEIKNLPIALSQLIETMVIIDSFGVVFEGIVDSLKR